jgi:glycosyltransferase involved in cell wall biosynthesis
MIHELFPEMYAPNNKVSDWKKHVIQKASAVIAISENTKRDIIRVYGLNDAKIEVVHLASSMRTVDAPSECMSLPDKYLLYVGLRTGYKNFRFFIEALVPLLKDDADLTIICAGGGNFTPEEISLFDSHNVAGRVRQSQVTDQSLATLYKSAVAFVFPSLYEGFGIPVLEAFNCGCPVILSNTSSLPEVAGNAAHNFDPYDKASLRAAVEKIIADTGYRKELQDKGFGRAKNFTWDKTARETESVYERLL